MTPTPHGSDQPHAWDEIDWEDLDSNVEVASTLLVERVKGELSRRVEGWSVLPEETRDYVMKAEVLFLVCMGTDEDYSEVVVSYGKALERLLREATGEDKKMLGWFATQFDNAPQKLRLHFRIPSPSELTRVARDVRRVKELRDIGAHADTDHRASYVEGQESRRLMLGFEAQPGLLSVLAQRL